MQASNKSSIDRFAVSGARRDMGEGRAFLNGLTTADLEKMNPAAHASVQTALKLQKLLERATAAVEAAHTTLDELEESLVVRYEHDAAAYRADRQRVEKGDDGE